MARPSAITIMSSRVNDQVSIDILSANNLYAILYKDQPFNIRQKYWTVKGEFPKYIRTVFPNKKPADNLAKKLNDEFMTNEFQVKKIL